MIQSLEKIIQSQGFGTRRNCQKLIHAGLVAIDGQVNTDHKAKFETTDLIFQVNQIEYTYRENLYIALYKPAGYECSHDPQHHRSIFSLLPSQFIERGIQCAGRLDQDTTGLIILTDDGKYLQALTHPKKHVAKRYSMTTENPFSDAQIQKLSEGVKLKNEGDTLFIADDIERISEKELAFTIHQGIYHQVKRMIASAGGHVLELHRESVGTLQLAQIMNDNGSALKPSEWVFLTEPEALLSHKN